MSETKYGAISTSDDSKINTLNNNGIVTSDNSNANTLNDNGAISIYDESDILFYVKEEKHDKSYKTRIGHMLHSSKWNLLILSMIVTDVIIVIIELFMQLSEVKNCNPPGATNESEHGGFSAVVHKLGYLSNLFLCIFTTEVFLHIWCFGVSYLFDAWINFVDSLTVLTTFTLTLFIWFYTGDKTTQGIVNLLIIIRFWRIFCLVEAVANATKLEANLRFKEVLTDIKGELRIQESKCECYREKLQELGYNIEQLETEYFYPATRKVNNSIEKNN